MKEFRYQLGDIVEDVVTKFKGTVVAQSRHVTGCDRLCIQPACKDGDTKPADCMWVDDLALTKVGEDAAVLELVRGKREAGAVGDPPKRGVR